MRSRVPTAREFSAMALFVVLVGSVFWFTDNDLLLIVVGWAAGLFFLVTVLRESRRE